MESEAICTRCNRRKLISEFPPRNGRRKKHHSWCRECARKKYQEYNKRREPIAHSDYESFRRNGYKFRAIQYFGNKCADCKQTYPSPVYDFHHLDPITKDITPSRLFNRSWKRILPELSTLIMLCANCHRIRHWTHPRFELTEGTPLEVVQQ